MENNIEIEIETVGLYYARSGINGLVQLRYGFSIPERLESVIHVPLLTVQIRRLVISKLCVIMLHNVY